MAPPRRSPDHRTPNMDIWLEPPDLVLTSGRGLLTEVDMAETAAFYDKHIRGWPYLLLVGDQTQQTGTSAGARKASAKLFEWVPFRGIALYGGSLTDRTVGKLILTLINALWKRDDPVMFVKTEDEAFAWIEQRRQELAGAKKAG